MGLAARLRYDDYPRRIQRLRERPAAEIPLVLLNVNDAFAVEPMGYDPKDLRASRERLFEDLKREYWRQPVRIINGPHEAWSVGRQDREEIARVFFHEELASDYTGLEQPSILRAAYAPRDRYSAGRPVGWWCVDPGAGFAIFAREQGAHDFLEILKNTVIW